MPKDKKKAGAGTLFVVGTLAYLFLRKKPKAPAKGKKPPVKGKKEVGVTKVKWLPPK